MRSRPRFTRIIIIPGLGEFFRRAAREARPHDELSEDAGSIRHLMSMIAKRLESGPRPLRGSDWKRSLAANNELKQHERALLRALKNHRGALAASTCSQIARWAEDRNALRSAAYFVEAAAAFDPTDPALTVRAGRLARRRADFERASDWYKKTIELGTAAQNWDAVATGWSGLGRIARDRGETPEDAATYHMRALAIARKHGLALHIGEGFHALAVLAIEQHKYHDGITYARTALDSYGRNQPRIVLLANDLAWLWMDKDHAYRRVLPIFRACARFAETPANQIVMLGNLARAAAGVGDVHLYEDAKTQLKAALPHAQDQEGHAQALLELAKGAAMLERLQEARKYGETAVAAAKTRQERARENEAHEFLSQLGVRRVTETKTHSKPVQQRIDDLAMELVLAMR